MKALFCGLLESTGVVAKSVIVLPLQAARLSAHTAPCSYSGMVALGEVIAVHLSSNFRFISRELALIILLLLSILHFFEASLTNYKRS